MNKKTWIVTSTLLVISGASFGVLDPPKASASSSPNTHQVLSQLETMNIQFQTPTTAAKLSADQAKQIAASVSPYYAKEAKNVVVEYQLITDPAIHLFPPQETQQNQQVAHDGYLNQTPCYVVSYEGISKRGKGKASNIIHHEYNIVIDANTGVPLFGFDYQ